MGPPLTTLTSCGSRGSTLATRVAWVRAADRKWSGRDVLPVPRRSPPTHRRLPYDDPAVTASEHRPEPSGGLASAIVWSWRRAGMGAAYAVPAAIATLTDPSTGIPLAVGVIPAAILPLPAVRRSRIVILLVGFLAGLSLFLGGVLAHLPTWLGASLLAAAVVGAAALSARLPRGQIVLTLCVPLMAAGLSYTDYATSAATFLLLTAGAAYAWLVSLLWPAGEPSAAARPPAPEMRPMLGYGARLGIASAIAYLVASGLQLDHPGWAPAACLLIARPDPDLLRTRGIGRVVAVIAGALGAALALHADPPNQVYAALAIAVLASAAATAGSRWYITSAFTTFFVFLMLLFDHPEQTTQKFNERVGETLIGVALAYLFAIALPAALLRDRPRDPDARSQPPRP